MLLEGREAGNEFQRESKRGLAQPFALTPSAQDHPGRPAHDWGPAARAPPPAPAGPGGGGPGAAAGGFRVNKCFRRLLSRREADRAVAEGRVAVNGRPAGPGDRVRPGDRVELDGRRVRWEELNLLPGWAPPCPPAI